MSITPVCETFNIFYGTFCLPCLLRSDSFFFFGEKIVLVCLLWSKTLLWEYLSNLHSLWWHVLVSIWRHSHWTPLVWTRHMWRHSTWVVRVHVLSRIARSHRRPLGIISSLWKYKSTIKNTWLQVCSPDMSKVFQIKGIN